MRFAAMLYVGRNADRRWNDVLEARSTTSAKRTHGDQATTAWPISSIPRRPARPVSCVYLMMLSGELRELLDDDGARRHVDPDCQRLGGEHDLDQSRDEALLHDLLHRWDHAGVVSGDADVELGHELVVAEHS
jgi:hypothetical protein